MKDTKGMINFDEANDEHEQSSRNNYSKKRMTNRSSRRPLDSTNFFFQSRPNKLLSQIKRCIGESVQSPLLNEKPDDSFKPADYENTTSSATIIDLDEYEPDKSVKATTNSQIIDISDSIEDQLSNDPEYQRVMSKFTSQPAFPNYTNRRNNARESSSLGNNMDTSSDMSELKAAAEAVRCKDYKRNNFLELTASNYTAVNNEAVSDYRIIPIIIKLRLKVGDLERSANKKEEKLEAKYSMRADQLVQDLIRAIGRGYKISPYSLVLVYRRTPLFGHTKIGQIACSGGGKEEEALRIDGFDRNVYEIWKTQHESRVVNELNMESELLRFYQETSSEQINDESYEDLVKVTDSNEKISVNIKTKNTTETFTIDPQVCTFAQLLEKFWNKSQLDKTDGARLIFDGEAVNLTDTIQSAGLEDDDMLELWI